METVRACRGESEKLRLDLNRTRTMRSAGAGLTNQTRHLWTTAGAARRPLDVPAEHRAQACAWHVVAPRAALAAAMAIRRSAIRSR